MRNSASNKFRNINLSSKRIGEDEYLSIRCVAYSSDHFSQITPVNNLVIRNTPDSHFIIECTTEEVMVIYRVEDYTSYCIHTSESELSNHIPRLPTNIYKKSSRHHAPGGKHHFKLKCSGESHFNLVLTLTNLLDH